MKKRDILIMIMLCILAVCWLFVDLTKAVVPAEDYEEKLRAAQHTEECMEMIHHRKVELGIEIDTEDDINQTGMIGPDYSAITTTLGNIEAKRTSTNPNMAAVVVDMINELGLKPGDKIAINCSGSFPALNIAVMCAVEETGLMPLLVCSFGASTHGANDPEFTYLDMENFLYNEGLLNHRSNYFSIGGMGDCGKEMSAEVKSAVMGRLESYGYTLLYDDDLLHNIADRYKLYNEYGDIRCFVNVGGNDVSFGNSSIIVHADGGILTELSENDHSTGLVQLFLENGVPVIHLLNIKSVAAQYDLPIDPSPLPKAGQGDVYYEYSYNKHIAAAGLLLGVAVLIAVRKTGSGKWRSGGCGRY